MNVLYLCHRIPYPPDKGDKIRSFHHLEYLAREHRVHLACLIDDPDDRAHVATLGRYCASVDTAWRGRTLAAARAGLALLGPGSLSVAAFHSGELRRKVERRLASDPCDVAVVYSSAMGQYVPKSFDRPVVVDFVDVDSEKWRVYADFKPWPLSTIYREEAARLRRYDEALALRYRESVFVSQKEVEIFRPSGGGEVRTHVIPMGVDLDHYRPPDSRPADAPPSLVFVGMMDYFPNVDAVSWFAEQVVPRVLAAAPGTVFRIVGRRPVRRVRALSRHPGVEVTGAVPDVRPYLAQAAVSVAPFRVARGMQNKVLEAMAMALPVVGTPVGFQGIGARAGDGVRIAGDPDTLATEVIALLRDPALRSDCGLRARRYVERHHRWQDQGAALNALLAEVVRRGPVDAAAERVS